MRRPAHASVRRRVVLAVALAIVAGARTVAAQDPGLIVFNAGSLGIPFKALLEELARRRPGLKTAQENGPSLQMVRKLTELGQVPDVLASADRGLLPGLVVPKHADWYVEFGSNAMVLAYSDRSAGAKEITRDNWWRILLRSDVRTGRSDPAIDPSGYRALMALQLAEPFYHEAGLGARLLAAHPDRYVRPAETELSALIQSGDLDYAWTYESLALAHGLKYLKLPPEIDLSDPSKDARYAQASVQVPQGPGKAPLTLKGEAIVFALTIPRVAAHQAAAAAFVRLLTSADGRAILHRSGFTAFEAPRYIGTVPAGIR